MIRANCFSPSLRPPSTNAMVIELELKLVRNTPARSNRRHRMRRPLRLDMSQPVGRDMQLNDVQAGAYFRLTPTLRVGGAVALGDTPIAPDQRLNLPQQSQAPRVKLETNFKF